MSFFEGVGIFVCGIVIAWLIICMLSAIWHTFQYHQQKRTRLRIMAVQRLKREGFSHDEAIRLAEEQHP